MTGHIVALLDVALYNDPEGRGFDSQRGHWIFQLTDFAAAVKPWGRLNP
jgi:hypothetical protein